MENLSIVLGFAFAIVVEHLFLVPAMDHSACHLDEIRALLGSRAYSAEIATGAVLSRSVSQANKVLKAGTYHMLQIMSASADVVAGHLG